MELKFSTLLPRIFSKNKIMEKIKIWENEETFSMNNEDNLTTWEIRGRITSTIDPKTDTNLLNFRTCSEP